jgi:hypothetical protein
MAVEFVIYYKIYPNLVFKSVHSTLVEMYYVIILFIVYY